MKKRGFTLIELLAVIVVLAIIALIATPIVMNTIKNTQKGAVERSADNYLSAVELAIATRKLEDNTSVDGVYRISDGQLLGSDLTIEINGDYPKNGIIKIENGQVVKSETILNYDDYKVTMSDLGQTTADERSIINLCQATEPIAQPVWNSGEVLMETVVVGEQATESDPYALGAVYSCNLGDGDRIFYVLASDEDTVTLIMNENLVDRVTWCKSGTSNSCAADGAIAALTESTLSWTRLVEASGMVGLPSKTILQNASPSAYTPAKWLITNIDVDEGYFYSYWTSTPATREKNAYSFHYAAGIQSLAVNSTDSIRPVITISKDNMSL